MSVQKAAGVRVRPLLEADLAEADRIMRLAFGTFLKLPDPMAFMGDANYVYTRWRADPSAAFAAEREGKLVGSVFATSWGSVGFFGPLTVHPDLWDAGVASLLMEPVMECFKRWKVRHAGLLTFAESPKHIGLYRKFGFWPRFLTGFMVKEVGAGPVGKAGLVREEVSAAPVDKAGPVGKTGLVREKVSAAPVDKAGLVDGEGSAGETGAGPGERSAQRAELLAAEKAWAGTWTRFSDVAGEECEALLTLCRRVTDSIYEGLDLTREIRAVADQRLGETVLLWTDDKLVGLAVCHCGAGSEAGSGICYIKVAAVQAGEKAGDDFRRLLSAVEDLARGKGLTRILGGANTGRKEAYEAMVECGYRSNRHSIIMEKPNEAGYNRPGVYMIDDWR